MVSGLPSRCPHCQEELPERGRFCTMCGCRIEGWAGLIQTQAEGPVGIPEKVSSGTDETRKAEPSAVLLRSASGTFDEEAFRPTMEIPSVGYEVRALAPNHRVHTSPTGNILPQGVQTALGAALGAVPKASHGRMTATPDNGRDGIPVPVSEKDERTDHIRVQRRSPLAETLHLGLLALTCASVAVLVGLFAYRLMTRVADGGAVILTSEDETRPMAPTRRVSNQGSKTRGRTGQGRELGHGAPGIHRTRDLVVSLPQQNSKRPAPALAGSLPVQASAIGPAPAPLHVDPRPKTDKAKEEEAEVAPQPPRQLTEEEQRSEAEAALAAADIEFVASTHNVQVRQCHERAFKENPGGQRGGKVELAFTLNEEGKAVGISTAVNTTGSELLARCLEGRIAEWRFPRPVGGAKQYQFPFVFLAGSGGVR